jgi:hypothetical protein
MLTIAPPMNPRSTTLEASMLTIGVPEAPAGLYADSGRITQKSIILYWTSGSNRGSAILEYQIMYNVKSEPGEWYLAKTNMLSWIFIELAH